MHEVIPIPKVLRIDYIFASIRHSSFYHVYVFELWSDCDFFVTP